MYGNFLFSISSAFASMLNALHANCHQIFSHIEYIIICISNINDNIWLNSEWIPFRKLSQPHFMCTAISVDINLKWIAPSCQKGEMTLCCGIMHAWIYRWAYLNIYFVDLDGIFTLGGKSQNFMPWNSFKRLIMAMCVCVCISLSVFILVILSFDSSILMHYVY